MRNYSKAALLCLVLATQACTLTLPTGLVNTTGGKGGDDKGGGNVSGNESCTALFFKLDTNGDKELTEDEYVRGRLGNVKPADADTEAEAVPPPTDAKKPTNEERREVLTVRTIEDDIRAGFKALDVDNNGRVNKDEFMMSCDGGVKPSPGPSATPNPTKSVPVDVLPDDGCSPEFSRYDENKDGKWTREEYERFSMRPIPMIAYCGDATVGPGVVTNNGGDLVSNNGSAPQLDRAMIQPECGTPPQYQTHAFEKYDMNQDGAIASKEFCEVQGRDPNIMPPPPVGYDCKETFLRADANQDGRVDFREYSQADYSPPPPDGMARPAVMPSDEEMKRRFSSKDANRDGYLTAEEFCGPGIKPLPTPTPVSPGTCDEFSKLDGNRDGFVKWEEFYREPGPNENVNWETYKDDYYRKFKSYDQNGNGHIDPSEMCGGGPIIQQPPTGDKCTQEFYSFDRDRSGFVTYDEYAAGRYGQIRFIQAPSQEEASKFIYDFKARARNFDANGDEQLSLEEFTKGCY